MGNPGPRCITYQKMAAFFAGGPRNPRAEWEVARRTLPGPWEFYGERWWWGGDEWGYLEPGTFLDQVDEVPAWVRVLNRRIVEAFIRDWDKRFDGMFWENMAGYIRN